MTPAEVATVERLEFRAFPPGEEVEFGGWQVRATKHARARRVNSATTPLTLPPDLPTDLERIEAFYHDRSQDSIIRVLSPAPSEIDRVAAARGYTHEAETFVLVGRGADTQVSHDVVVYPHPVGEWVDAKQRWVGMTEEQVESWRVRAAAIPGVTAYAVLHVDAMPRAIGLGVVEDGWLGVFDVNTDPDYRRSGHASTLMRGLTAWARPEGADRSYLQVQGDNVAALGLYRALGYAEAYRYWYRRKSLGDVRE